MTLYEERMKEVKDNDKVVFYDYLLYKRESGWFAGIFNDDWYRPKKIQIAMVLFLKICLNIIF